MRRVLPFLLGGVALCLGFDAGPAGTARGQGGATASELVGLMQGSTVAGSPEPDSAEAHCDRGLAAVAKGDVDRAIQEFTRAIELRPDDAMAYCNRGGAYGDRGEWDSAVRDLLRAAQIDPNLVIAHYNLGNVYGARGEWDRAVEAYTKAIELQPDYLLAYCNRGIVHVRRADLDRAIADFTRCVELKPDLAMAHFNRGKAYADKGEPERAALDLSEAQRLEPNQPRFMRALAWLLATCPQDSIRDGGRALKLAKRACELTGWGNPDCLSALAAACAEAGQYEEAAKWEGKALLDPSLPRAKWDSGRAQLKLYEAGKPYREMPPTPSGLPGTSAPTR
jgi:tetratricopeptide (TPR) repeat protein